MQQNNAKVINPVAPSTPRSNMCTPRRLVKPLAQTPECFIKVTLEIPKSTRNAGATNTADELTNLTVSVRIRPMNAKELHNVCITNAVTETNNTELTVRSTITGGSALNLDHFFEYDHVLCSSNAESNNYASQRDVFNKIGKPLLDNAFRGFNACLFAYGQTGSGKSYSMMGDNTGDTIDIDNNAGITPRFCRELFKRIDSLIASVTIHVSYFEIYNEKIHDLLSASSAGRAHALKVREHPVWGPYVVDLSVHEVTNYTELRSFLILGNRNRATTATAMNEKSSRSHSIFTIELSLTEGNDAQDLCRRSKVSLVDLAGSERLCNATVNDDERVKQGVSINKSLLTLGKVITGLADQKKSQFIPYRDSVLTWLLKESLGGNSLTSMLATISPASCSIEETLATLRYACQARSIVNRARINENPHDKIIRELKAEVDRLRALRQSYQRTSIISKGSNEFIGPKPHQELEQLRDELKNTEQRLKAAEATWEQRFRATTEAQAKELAAVESRKKELESHLRVLKDSDARVSMSVYKSTFISDLRKILHTANNKENREEGTVSKLGKHAIKATMSKIYSSLAVLQPTVNDSPENIKLKFARINKLLQAFETALTNSVSQPERAVFTPE